MSEFVSHIADETRAEIARLEAKTISLREFLLMIDPPPAPAPKKKPARRKKAKRGRPTNAERAARAAAAARLANLG